MSMKGFIAASLLLLNVGCVQIDPVLTASIAPLTETLLSNINRQQAKVVFFNRLSGNRLVPMLPASIDTISFDDVFERKASEYKDNEGLQEVLPFIEPGEHFIRIKFRQQENAITVPIIIPESKSQKITLLVSVAQFNPDIDIKVGYDLDNNLEVDPERPYYQSQDGKTFLEYLPDGTVQEWKSQLEQGNSERIIPDPNAQALPPGADSIKPSSTQRPPKVEREQRPPPIGVPQIPQQKPIPIPARVRLP